MPTNGQILARIQSCESWIASNHVLVHGVGKDRILKANLLPVAHEILKGAQGWTPTSVAMTGLIKVEQISGSLKLRYKDTNMASQVLKCKVNHEYKYHGNRISFAMDENKEQRQERNAGMELVHCYNQGQIQYTARWRRDFDNLVGKIMVKSRVAGDNNVQWKFMGDFASEYKEFIDIGRDIRDGKRPPLERATVIGNLGASSSSSSAMVVDEPAHAPAQISDLVDNDVEKEGSDMTPQRGLIRGRPSTESTPDDTNFIQKVSARPSIHTLVGESDAGDLDKCMDKFQKTSISPPIRRSDRFKLKPKKDFRALHTGRVNADTTI